MACSTKYHKHKLVRSQVLAQERNVANLASQESDKDVDDDDDEVEISSDSNEV